MTDFIVSEEAVEYAIKSKIVGTYIRLDMHSKYKFPEVNDEVNNEISKRLRESNNYQVNFSELSDILPIDAQQARIGIGEALMRYLGTQYRDARAQEKDLVVLENGKFPYMLIKGFLDDRLQLDSSENRDLFLTTLANDLEQYTINNETKLHGLTFKDDNIVIKYKKPTRTLPRLNDTT